MSDPISVGIVASAAAYVLRPVAEFLKTISGPLATEIGEAAADPVREWRARRAAAVIVASREMLEAAEIEPGPVPPKLLVPIAEASSLEHDDSLTARWAALLANAAAGEHGAPVQPRFIAILQQLTPADSVVLARFGEIGSIRADFPDAELFAGLPSTVGRAEAFTALDTLMSLGLIEREGFIRLENNEDIRFVSPDERRIAITHFGAAFLRAVSPPEAATA